MVNNRYQTLPLLILKQGSRLRCSGPFPRLPTSLLRIQAHNFPHQLLENSGWKLKD